MTLFIGMMEFKGTGPYNKTMKKRVKNTKPSVTH